MEIDRLVFLEESGADRGMTRLHGRGSSGERVVDYTPDVGFERA
jgi:hypothetical protein